MQPLLQGPPIQGYPTNAEPSPGMKAPASEMNSSVSTAVPGSQRTHDKDGPDVVFIAHPAYLTDMFALFYWPSPDHRWTPSWWMYPLLPILWLIGFLLAHLRRRICCKSYVVVDDHYYNGVRVQTWIVHHFGRHFRNSYELHDSRRNVEYAALDAEKAGARVLGLGALNKAEFLNHGGKDLLNIMPKDRTMAITHGNHLTAAATVETIRQLWEAGFMKGKPAFMTGATSKTGRAVAIALWKFYQVPLMLHTTSPERGQEVCSHGVGGLEWTENFEDGEDSPVWIIGKYDLRVCDHMPRNSVACVFAVPDPLTISGKRPDVKAIEGATLHIDESRLDKPRRFSNLLKSHEIYACHAGSIVRASRPELGTADELGEIDPDSLPEYIREAQMIGITVPPAPIHLLQEQDSEDSDGDENSALC
eukprot:TRINITY_DN32658_c0_g1_i2.p1 TRINITY_DN32658_c0_g1~~TRINITY_DN32658_c0_g1_i2.p1  ORF type:complete len:419 (+),score=62.34 TRINITY_DN32658_c0_g1_i2:66-1322(+)